jgi:hypothetical protein
LGIEFKIQIQIQYSNKAACFNQGWNKPKKTIGRTKADTDYGRQKICSVITRYDNSEMLYVWNYIYEYE